MSTGPDDASHSKIAGSINRRTHGYRERLDKLTPRVSALADSAFALFLRDPRHPSLRNHRLDDVHRGRHRAGSRSVAISKQYRVIYTLDGDTNVWYWIGSHSDYNNFTGRK